MEKRTKIQLALLPVVLALGFYKFVLPNLPQPLPDCDSTEVVALTQQILSESPLLQAMTIGSEVTLDGHTEDRFDDANNQRICKAILKTALGSERAEYVVQWHDESKGTIWVEFLE